MTAEHLLDAIGLLDDDLIQDAEARPAPVVPLRVRVRRWGSLAACLALVLAIGYGVTHLRMGSSSNSSSAPSFSSGMDAADSSAEAVEPSASSEANSGSTSLDGQAAASGLIHVDHSVYALTGDIVDAPPEGSRSLGVLSQFYPDSPSPATDVETYTGYELWAAGENSIPETVYVQLPEGGYAVAELVQP